MVDHLIPRPDAGFRQMGAYLIYNSHWVEPQSGKEVARSARRDAATQRFAGQDAQLFNKLLVICTLG